MNRPGGNRITEPPAGDDGLKGPAFLNLGRFMVLLGLVNPPFWGSIIRGINKGTLIACAVFSGLMILFGVVLTLIGHFPIARDMRHTSGQRDHSHSLRR